MKTHTKNFDRCWNGASWLWLVLDLGVGGYLITSGVMSAPKSAGSANELALSSHRPASVPHATRKIEEIRVGMRVLGANPDASEVDESLPDPVAADWRHISLRMAKENGDTLAIELLRPVEWLSFYEVAVGRTIDLDLSEMGAEGPAEVLAVEPCPPLPRGPGNVVTGTFAHRSAGDLINLQLAGEPRPTGVTRNHRYWSEDRQAFVAAGDLRLDERLLTATGAATTVVAITPRPTNEPVYNLEVHREHVYLVGELGVLVHNSYEPGIDGGQLRSSKTIKFSQNSIGNELSDGRRLNETISMLRSNRSSAARIEPIGLAKFAELPSNIQQKLLKQGASESDVFAVTGNRRLFAARRANSEINSRFLSSDELSRINLDDRFTTTTAGRGLPRVRQ